jgi:NDP-sugar pyrophosphorylase family protein
MKAVALIGGEGTRLRPITQTVPKSMVPLRNKPHVE